MDYVASLIGVSTGQLQTYIGAALLVIVIGLILRFFWKFLIVGAIAVVVVAFVHERTQRAPAIDANAGYASPLPASAVETAPSAQMPKEKLDFLDKCVADGENNRQECVDLWAEKLYVEQGASQPEANR